MQPTPRGASTMDVNRWPALTASVAVFPLPGPASTATFPSCSTAVFCSSLSFAKASVRLGMGHEGQNPLDGESDCRRRTMGCSYLRRQTLSKPSLAYGLHTSNQPVATGLVAAGNLINRVGKCFSAPH